MARLTVARVQLASIGGMKPRIPLPLPFADQPFTRAQALAAGLGSNRLNGSDLARPFHGVRVPAHRALTLEERCRAFSNRMPALAFFSSTTAAQLIGVPLPLALQESPLIHVAVPWPARASGARGVRGHSVLLMGNDSHSRGGLRLSTPTRLWCELGAVVCLPDLVAAGDYLIHWRLPFCSRSDLADAVERYPGRIGKARLVAALALLSDRSESPRESVLRVLLVEGGIMGLAVNLRVTVRGMRFRLDLALPEYKLALEYQGGYHNDVSQWRKDMTKREVLATDGWLTMDFNADDLVGTELVERVKIVIAARS